MSALIEVPPNFFAIPFGLAGLGGVWRLEATSERPPSGIADALFLIAAVAWLALVVGCLIRWARAPRLIFGEITDSVLAPFWALPLIVGMQLSVALQPHAADVARVCFELFLGLTVLFGGWVTGQWLTGQLMPSEPHPGYFLPTVAGGLIGAQGAAAFGLTGLAWTSFGIGIACWLILGSLVASRLMLFQLPPPGLLPTIAIELAPSGRGRGRLLRPARHQAGPPRLRSGRLRSADGGGPAALRAHIPTLALCAGLDGPDDELSELGQTLDDLVRAPGSLVRGPAPLRGQRLPRTTHAPRRSPDPPRSRPRRPEPRRRHLAVGLPGSSHPQPTPTTTHPSPPHAGHQ